MVSLAVRFKKENLIGTGERGGKAKEFRSVSLICGGDSSSVEVLVD